VGPRDEPRDLRGLLEERDEGGYRFRYDPDYLASPGSPISLTLPKRAEPYEAGHLFPFFYGLLAEGSTRTIQHRVLRIDEDDAFGLLLATAQDTVGSVTVVRGET